MSNNKEWKRMMDEQRAAHLLMVEFVKNNANVVASVLEPIIGLWHEVTYESLKDNVGVVSQVFAGVALTLIDHNSNFDRNDPDNMVLPVGARTMNNTIEDLSKFIESTRSLFMFLIEKYDDSPAIDMTKRAFYKYEPQM